MKDIGEKCEMFGDVCRHCSSIIDRRVVRFSLIKDIPDLGKKGEIVRRTRRIDLGQFCNNDGQHFVKDLKYCPARWALARPAKMAVA